MNIDWRNDAACLQYDPEMFFPKPGPNMMKQVAEAVAICKECPARNACLEDALLKADVHGIRAGLGEKERRKLLRARHVRRAA